MISVGIDVSKGKSMVCILKPYGEVVCSPFEVMHTEQELNALGELLKRLNGEIRVVMEATGIYHLPILTYLHEKGFPFKLTSLAWGIIPYFPWQCNGNGALLRKSSLFKALKRK